MPLQSVSSSRLPSSNGSPSRSSGLRLTQHTIYRSRKACSSMPQLSTILNRMPESIVFPVVLIITHLSGCIDARTQLIHRNRVHYGLYRMLGQLFQSTVDDETIQCRPILRLSVQLSLCSSGQARAQCAPQGRRRRSPNPRANTSRPCRPDHSALPFHTKPYCRRVLEARAPHSVWSMRAWSTTAIERRAPRRSRPTVSPWVLWDCRIGGWRSVTLIRRITWKNTCEVTADYITEIGARQVRTVKVCVFEISPI